MMKMRSKRTESIRWLTLLLSIMLCAGCITTGSVATRTPTVSAEHQAALDLLAQGQPDLAAQRLESQAALISSTTKRAPLLADAAFAWANAGDSMRARQLAAQIDPVHLKGESQARFALLTAEFAIADSDPTRALAVLDACPVPMPAALSGRAHQVRAQAFEAQGNGFAAAEALAHADGGLHGQAQRDNRRKIEQLLSQVDDTTLFDKAAALPQGNPLYNFAGRALLRRGRPLPRQFDRNDQWLFDASARPPADYDGYRPPLKLAVLLPLSGSLAAAAAPVRDGLLTGYYGESRRRPEVLFYDTLGTAEGALSAYQQAASDGADFITGPLARDEVNAVFNNADLSVPLLALNRGDAPPPPGNASFALAPDDDGVAAAEYLIGLERRNPIVIAATDDSSQRSAIAFQNRIKERGGNVVAIISANEAAPALVGQLVGAAAQADAVFLVVRGAQARLLAPQLAAAGLGTATRVATSQITSGIGKPEEDIVLDGIVFPTETWTAQGFPHLPSHNTIAPTLPTARGAAARLFAFGYDAWLITAYLERMVRGTQSDLPGATGVLYLDGFGNIVRTPAWATFINGVTTPLGQR